MIRIDLIDLWQALDRINEEVLPEKHKARVQRNGANGSDIFSVNEFGQVIFEPGTTWKQISKHMFFPKDTSLESEKIEVIWVGTGCGGQNVSKCSR